MTLTMSPPWSRHHLDRLAALSASLDRPMPDPRGGDTARYLAAAELGAVLATVIAADDTRRGVGPDRNETEAAVDLIDHIGTGFVYRARQYGGHDLDGIRAAHQMRTDLFAYRDRHYPPRT